MIEKNIKRKLYLLPKERKYKDFYKNKIFGFDIETYGKKNEFLFASLINDNEKKSFYDIQSLVDFLSLRENFNCIIIATNLQFDFFGCFMKDYHDRIKPCMPDGRLISAQFLQYSNSTQKTYCQFYDTSNILMSSVKNLGKSIGIKKHPYPPNFKMKILSQQEIDEGLESYPIDVRIPKDKNEWNLLEEYCHNDAYISYKWFTSIYMKSCELVGTDIAFTSAKTSLNDFQTNHLHEEIEVKTEYHPIIRSAYYGGRTECFKRGKAFNINVYDFNSLYPSCMIEDMPNPNSECYKKQCTIDDIKNFEGCTYVEGYQDIRYITCLPSKIDIDGDIKLCFCTGYHKGYWMNIELRKAIENGFKIHKIKDGLIYTKTFKYFLSFINEKYKNRLNFKFECQKCGKVCIDKKECTNCGGKLGNPLEGLEKLKMNSLYGKFGYVYEERNVMLPEYLVSEKDLQNSSRHEIHTGSGNNWVEIVFDNGEPSDYCIPIWSSQVTAIARLKLFDKLNNKEIQKNITYCDTDSLFLMNNIEIPSSSNLGDVKLEYNTKFGIFVRPKFYFTKKPKLKGISSVKTYTHFMDAIKNKRVIEQRFQRALSVIKQKPHHKCYGTRINEIIDEERLIDVEDTKRDWLGTSFDVDKLQDSMPIYIDSKYRACYFKNGTYIPVIQINHKKKRVIKKKE